MSEEGRGLEAVAMSIVHQIGDTLYEALPPDIAHKYFVDARQATNDKAIDFAMALIARQVAAARLEELESLLSKAEQIVTRTDRDGLDWGPTAVKNDIIRQRIAALQSPHTEAGGKE